MNLITTQNAKTVKGEKKGYLTGILYLKPQKSGGGKNLCPNASKICTLVCLNSAGRGAFNSVQKGRQRKTDLLNSSRQTFEALLEKDIEKTIKKARKLGLIPCFRINGTSDLPSLARKMAMKFPDVQFYDYTKIPNPQKRVLPNYHITFSRSEDNWQDCETALKNGVNVAVVFDKIPETYKGFKVVNGDETDLRFLDLKAETGLIVGLKAKGKARKDFSGFVVR